MKTAITKSANVLSFSALMAILLAATIVLARSAAGVEGLSESETPATAPPPTKAKQLPQLVQLETQAAPAIAEDQVPPFVPKRSFRVRLTSDNMLPGEFQVVDAATLQIRPASQVAVSFIRDGLIVRRAWTGPDGMVQISGLTPGVYSVLAWGLDGFAAFGIHAVAWAEEGVDDDRLALGLDVLLVPDLDLPVVREMIATLPLPNPVPFPNPNPVPNPNPLLILPPAASGSTDAPGVFVSEESDAPSDKAKAEPAPPLVEPAPPLVEPVPPLVEPVPPLVEPAPQIIDPPKLNRAELMEKRVATPIKSPRLLVHPDRPTPGFVSLVDPVTGVPISPGPVRLTFIQSGRVVSRAITDADGVFAVVGLQEGIYSVVAAAGTGFCAIAFEVEFLAADQRVELEDGTQIDVENVGFNLDESEEEILELPVIQPDAFGFLVAQAGGEGLGEFAPPVGGGPGFFGGGTSGAGGGGGGAGGGGFFEALAAGALGGAIGALASDDDDDGDESAAQQSPANPGLPN